MLGTDPELFLSLGGKYISAHGLFPGTKREPFPLEKGAVQVDGLALEFNIDPADDANKFDSNITTVLNQVNEMVTKVDKDLKINFTPYAKFDPKLFESIPFEAKLLGCSPDYNAYGTVNPSPEILNEPFRTAAGHIHIGWTKDVEIDDPAHFEDCLLVSKHFFDNSAKSFFAARTPLEKLRIQYYGDNGAFRPKSYGVELRSPSNIWVQNSDTRKEMFNFVMKQMENISTNEM